MHNRFIPMNIIKHYLRISSKSVNDAGWGYLLSKLAYKAESARREFIKVDPRGTSQICTCGQRVAKPPSVGILVRAVVCQKAAIMFLLQ